MMKKDFIPATKDMLQQAADGELVLFAPARRHTAKLHAFPSVVAPKQSNRSCAAGLVPIAPTLAKELLCFPDAQLNSYLAVDPTDCSPSHPWKDHYWVLDEPQTITREQIQGVMPADAPKTASKANNELPGKMPRTAIGKLAIKAAWEIECETAQRATVDAVIAKLQARVNEEDALYAIIKNGVSWQTTGLKVKDFDIDACSKALKAWHSSRA